METISTMESREKGSVYQKIWALLFAFLLLAFLAGVLFLFFKIRIEEKPLEIVLSPATPASEIEVYLSGAVVNPGIYSLGEDTTLKEIWERAGGALTDADLSRVEVRLPLKDESPQPQKVNINTAPDWLLQALPGIGEIRAPLIIDYRTQNGPFRSSEELKNVRGIGEAIFNKVKDFITVVD